MENLNIIKKIIKIAEEKKGENIVILNVKNLTTITDYFIIISASSIPHLHTLAREISFIIKKEFRKIPIYPYSETEEKWILLDYIDFIVHIFLPEVREYYNLEELWYEAKRETL